MWRADGRQRSLSFEDLDSVVVSPSNVAVTRPRLPGWIMQLHSGDRVIANLHGLVF